MLRPPPTAGRTRHNFDTPSIPWLTTVRTYVTLNITIHRRLRDYWRHLGQRFASGNEGNGRPLTLKVVPFEQEVPCWDDKMYRQGKTNYRFELPADHPPGTYWYHAHKHGSTNAQVSAGLAGR